MTDCDYCGASFNSEKAYHAHLRREHYEELGPIDKRRIGEGGSDDDDGVEAAPIALGVVILAAAAIVGYVVYVSATGTPQMGPPGSDHYHGPINVTIEGEQVDFTQAKYQRPDSPLHDRSFHFEGGDGSRWHAHATNVNLSYGMQAIGIPVTDESVTYEGTTYRNSDSGTTVVVEVNGNDVTPSSYILKEGDRIRVVVQRS